MTAEKQADVDWTWKGSDEFTELGDRYVTRATFTGCERYQT